MCEGRNHYVIKYFSYGCRFFYNGVMTHARAKAFKSVGQEKEKKREENSRVHREAQILDCSIRRVCAPRSKVAPCTNDGRTMRTLHSKIYFAQKILFTAQKNMQRKKKEQGCIN